MKPIRLQLSRRKNFDLQTLSRKFNGLAAVKVTRPGRWGNPFIPTVNIAPGRHVAGPEYFAVPSAAEAVACYRLMITQKPDLMAALNDLRGKNLACWCKLTEPCHADVLLELANPDNGDRTAQAASSPPS